MGLHCCNSKVSGLAAPISAWFGRVCGWPTWAQPTQHGLTPVPCNPHTPGKRCWVVTEPNALLLPTSSSPAEHGAGRQGKGDIPGVNQHLQENQQLSHGQWQWTSEPEMLLLSNLGSDQHFWNFLKTMNADRELASCTPKNFVRVCQKQKKTEYFCPRIQSFSFTGISVSYGKRKNVFWAKPLCVSLCVCVCLCVKK